MRDAFAAARRAATRLRALGPTTATSPRLGGESGFPAWSSRCRLSGSRGVIRADDRRPGRGARPSGSGRSSRDAGEPAGAPLLVESYVPGVEVAVEGLLRGGAARGAGGVRQARPARGPVLRGDDLRHAVAAARRRRRPRSSRCTADAAAALGLREGPIHAELRVDGDERERARAAARSIGGLCSRALRFGVGVSLEELILRHALGLGRSTTWRREAAASGRDDAPDPAGGRAGEVRRAGTRRGRCAGVAGLEITIARGTAGRAAARGRPLPRLPVRPGRQRRAGRARPAQRPWPAARSRSPSRRRRRACAIVALVRVLLISTYELGHQPLHVASPAAALRRAGHEVRCLDLTVEQLGSDDASSGPSASPSRCRCTPRCGWRSGAADASASGRPRPADLLLRPLRGGRAATDARRTGRPADRRRVRARAGRVGRGAGDSASAATGDQLDRPRARRAFRPRARPAAAARALRPAAARRRGARSPATSRPATAACTAAATARCPSSTTAASASSASDAVIADIAQLVAAGARHVTFGDPDFLNGVNALARRSCARLHRALPGADLRLHDQGRAHPRARRASGPSWPPRAASSWSRAFESVNDDILAHLDKGHTAAEAARRGRPAARARDRDPPVVAAVHARGRPPHDILEILDFVAAQRPGRQRRPGPVHDPAARARRARCCSTAPRSTSICGPTTRPPHL